MEYGLQLYSVRDITGSDFEGALREVAEMGYTMVEPAGFFGNDGKTVAEWLEKYGLMFYNIYVRVFIPNY